jgi:sulfur-oxidizing protein SoxA
MRLSFLCLLILQSVGVFAGPAEDRAAFREFFEKRFSNIPIDAHVDGAYALDAKKREQWLSMEDFPPYEFAVDDGQLLFEEPFADGSSYADCFADDGAVKHLYPQYDAGRETVVTLELAINDCRLAAGEEALAYKNQALIQLTAYMAFASRDKLIAIDVPPEAEPAYNAGKQYYYSRRGQLNFACSHCHMQISGQKLRAETLSASIGQVSHWPTYRLKWQEVGPLHRRFARCNQQVGAESLPFQSETYKNLEYFMSYMSNGMPINGPATRK